MIEEVGTIVELKSKAIAMVLCTKSSMCVHCVSAGLCQMGDDNRSMQVEALNPLGAQVGDRVRIVTSTRSFLQSSFILYIVPLIALVIGAAVGEMIGRHGTFEIESNLLAALTGSAFLAGSLLLIRVGSRAIPRETYMPRISEIIREE